MVKPHRPPVRAASIVLLLLLGACAGVDAPKRAAVPPSEMADPGRGELLYGTACASCHREQIHWRDHSIVGNWPDLVRQVERWQRIAGQNWRSQEIRDVAAYLNRRFYGLDCPLSGCARGTVG